MSLIQVTDAATERMRDMLANRGTPDAYIRFGVKTAGCSGLGYKLEFADAPTMGDETLELAQGVKLLIDPKSLIYVIGTQIDYKEEKLRSGFVFENPNKKGECGCGESFTV